MSYAYKPYPIGKHSAAVMVPKFYNSRTYAATIMAVAKALPDSAANRVIALAAYVWYCRSNRRKELFAPHLPVGASTEVYYAYDAEYRATGVYPVCPARLASIKPSTIAKYAKLLKL